MSSCWIALTPTPLNPACLQDNVPTFSTMEARVVLEDGLGRPVDTIFEWLSEEPLAAASLGQVGQHPIHSPLNPTPLYPTALTPSLAHKVLLLSTSLSALSMSPSPAAVHQSKALNILT